MSIQMVGILLGVFSALMAGVIFWGAFAEQKRAAGEFEAQAKQN
jgi:thiamine transporter ThiT